ncbi:response regulator [Pseudomonas sp. MM211]|uniref:ATP-binding protein n=1 Tax=Pseudomonas sp. MM211 TaxID=2866808 RepID=UPI001CED14BC|nr:ATP-binding protein [Pseudomonas sp. MM211]UCJ14898.1 response regulator [Pseudomonas sp. MM211]
MRVLICSDEASLLLPLLAPLEFTFELCDSFAMLLDALAGNADAVLIAEEVLAGQDERAYGRLFQSSLPLILLGAATVQEPCAALGGSGAVVLERPFTSRSLCSCLTALVNRSPGAVLEGHRSEGELALLQSQRMDAVGSLTSGIAHDFNNVLTGIIGALDIMKRRVANGRLEGIGRFIEAASVSADRASALTQRLLTFSHRQPLDARPVDVDPLLESLELLIRRTISKGISLQVDYRHGTARVLVDARQLESAILNLAVNARDAMPNGGQIRLHTALISLTREEMTALPDLLPGDYLLIAFSDTGYGISSDALEKVFDPFFTTKSIGQGSGLGLPMVHGFARQSGGQVTIHSEPGIGTTVRLYLPVAAGEQDPVANLVPEHALGHRVLLVESDSAVRLLVSEVLAQRRCEIVNAAEPQAAIELLASSASFDLLVSDINLPGITALQLVGLAQQCRPGLPVLLIAGDADDEPLASLPGLKRINKPFSMRELSETIDDMLPSRP